MLEMRSVIEPCPLTPSFLLPQASWEQVSDDGKVSASAYPMSETTITHHIVDRPKLLNGHHFEGRVYVQPQWVYDCVNAKKLIPIEPYTMGAILPPHLSPFVEYQPGDYVPGKKEGAVVDMPEDDEEADEVFVCPLLHHPSSSRNIVSLPPLLRVEPFYEGNGMLPGSTSILTHCYAKFFFCQEEDEEDMYAKELEAEVKGVTFSAGKETATAAGAKTSSRGTKRSAAAREADEEKELAKIMMSKKHKNLYNKIMHSKSQKQAEVCCAHVRFLVLALVG